MVVHTLNEKLKYLIVIAGIFLLLALPSIADEDGYSIQDNNNDCSGAKFFNYETHVAAGSINPEGDNDWWWVDLSSSGEMLVELDGSSGDDFDLYVHESCSSDWVCRPFENDADENCIVDAREGRYYFNIDGFDGTGDYKLYVSLEEKDYYDLAPVSILTDPKEPTNEDSMYIFYSAVNSGPDDITDDVELELYIDDDEYQKCTKEDGLDFLEYFSCEESNVRLDAGTHELKIVVDPDDDIDETNENNNELEKDLEIEEVNYDLIVYGIDTIPDFVDDKTPFKIFAGIQNIGDDIITDSYRTTISIDDEVVYTCNNVKDIGHNEFDSCSKSGLQLEAGSYDITVEVDVDNDIDETNENNNEKEEDLVVFKTPEHDFIVSDIYTVPSTLDDKTTFDLKWDITNLGPDDTLFEINYKSELRVDGMLKHTCERELVDGFLVDQIETCTFPNQQWATGSYGVKADVEVLPANFIKETDYGNNDRTENIEVGTSCPILDGSSDACSCNSNVECPSGYFCSITQGWNACTEIPCEDECDTAAGFLCIEGDVYDCGQFDNDLCNDKRLTSVCSLEQECLPGIGTCAIVQNPVQIKLDDAGSHNTIVYKQPGDLVELTISSDAPQNVRFDKPEEFLLKKGLCGYDSVGVDVGENKCLFEISEDTLVGNYYLTANEKSAKVSVIDNPKTIVITDSQKLKERFSNDVIGVNSLLKEAFQFSHDEENTVVYYLDRENIEHPFSSFFDYKEDFVNPLMTDNFYSIEVAKFSAEKCGECSNIIVLGDDFVVPFYRVDYAFIHSWWKLWVENKTETNFIYTDQPYIKEKTKTLGEIQSLFNNKEHKKVKFVVPDTLTSEVQDEINNLKAEIIVTFSYEENDIEEIKSESIGCNSYSELDDATLILLGNRDDNNAIKCVPWFDIGSKPTDNFKASIELERNVWANDEYALIVSGDDIASGLKNLIVLVDNPLYLEGSTLGQKDTVYIHDFSNPPDLPPNLKETASHIVGFALGTCEEGNVVGEKGACIATDMVAGVVPPADIITDVRDLVLYCPGFIWNKITGKKGELFDGLICGGSTAGTGITVGKYVTAVTGVGAVVGTVADGGSTALKTVLKVTKSSLGSGSNRMIKVLDKIELFKFDNAWKFFKSQGKGSDSLFDNVKRFTKVTSENPTVINKMTEHFPEEALAATIKNVDDYEDTIMGTRRILTALPSLDNAAPGADDFAKAAFMKNVGKLTGDTADDVAKISDVKGVDKLAKNIAESTEEGFAFEAKSAHNIRKAGDELIELGRKKTVDYIDPVTGKLVSKEVEIDTLWKNANGKKVGDEVKAVDWNGIKNKPFYKERLDKLEVQFKKLRAVDGIDEIRLVSKYEVTKEVIDLAGDYNILIKIGGGVA